MDICVTSRMEEALTQLRTGGGDVLLLDLAHAEASRSAEAEGPAVLLAAAGGRREIDGLEVVPLDEVDAGSLFRTLRCATRRGESERQYRLMFDRHAIPMWVASDDNRFLEVNEAAVREFGWTREEMLSMTIRDIYPREGLAELDEAIAKGRPDFEVRGSGSAGIQKYRRKDGSTFLAEVTWTWIPFRGRSAALVHAANVTDRVKAEEKLREADEIWRSLLEHSTDIIFILDRDFRVISVNRTAGDIPAERMIGRVIFDFALPGRREAVRHLYEKALRSETALTYETMGYGSNGQTAHYETRIIPIRRDGETVRLMLLSADITGRKLSEEDRRAQGREWEVLASLGMKALAGAPMKEVLEEAMLRVAQVLDAPFCKVEEACAGGRLEPRAGHGWGTQAGEAPAARSLERAALASREAVVVVDFDDETRFARGPVFEAHGVLSGIAVAIPGTEGPWGVLGAYFGRRRGFAPHEAAFLGSLAKLVGALVKR